MATFVPWEEGNYDIDELYVLTDNGSGNFNKWYLSIVENSDTSFDDLGDGEIGIMFEFSEDDDGNSLYDWHAVFEHDDPTFASGEWTSAYKYEYTYALASEESTAIAEIYGYDSSDSLADRLSSAMQPIAEVISTSLAAPAHPLNKIKSPVIDKDAFDVFEKEEAAQAVTVSTTYETTT